MDSIMSSKRQLKTKDMDITENILNNFALIRKNRWLKWTHVYVINYYKQIIKKIVSLKNKKTRVTKTLNIKKAL